ncbi:alpha/beta fold hydrolase, partial [Acidobacteria bacterium AH-259-A15]|nr:alpha/beta fold hydrolase [Acidobacteria bacterium AH-259-A15]
NSLLRRFEWVLKNRPFRPPFYLSGGHLQTLAASVLKRNFSWGWTNSEEYYVDLPGGSCIRADCVGQYCSGPTLVAVHGMAGSSASTYMQGLSHKAYREGWNAVLLNLYNCNRALPRPKVFHSGSSLEIGQILKELVVKRNLEELFLVGISMGGNMVLKLLGEWGSDFPIHVRAAAVISPLVDLTVSWKILEKPSNFLFQHHFVKNFKRLIKQHSSRLSPFVDVEAILRIKTIREFDQLFTAPLGGFHDAFDYYEKVSALPRLKDIRVPTLVLHARDDPLLPWQPFVLPEVCSNPSLLINLTGRGGHMGFLEQDAQGDIDRRWAENRVIDFFRLAGTPDSSQEPVVS